MFDRECSLQIKGFVPSKKNRWKQARGGRVYIPRDVKDQLDYIELQIRQQWRRKPMLRHPMTVFRFFVSAKMTSQDRDNKEQTVLDCMVRAGVLVDDSIKNFNEWSAKAPAVIHGGSILDDTCVVNLSWREEDEIAQEV